MNNDNSLQKVQLNSSEVAFAIKKFEDSPVLGLYIPTLMSEIEMQDRPYEKNVILNDAMIKNKDKGFSFNNIKLANYYKVGPYDPAIYYTEIELGEQVRIKFLDNDIKKCYYYDDTYKMTDALMEQSLDLQEQIEKMNKKLLEMEKRLSSIEGMISNDSE